MRHRGALGAGERGDAVVVKPRRERAKTARMGPQVVDQPRAVHRQPREVQRDPHLVVQAKVRQRLVQLVVGRRIVQLLGVTVPKRHQHGPHEGLPRLVVRLARALRLVDGRPDIGVEHADREAVHVHGGQVLRNPFAQRDGVGHDLRHATVSLELGGERRVRRGRLDARDEVGDGAADDARLAERGQHLVDVAQERRARADDQHAGALQRAPVRVQQVCGAVQRDRSLAGAGPALHHQSPVEI